jgi:DNA-binding MarR family transcriptional regulator
MPTYKHPHGTTFHQTIVLAIIANEGPITSGQIAERYQELTNIDVAYNYQYIITRRMADRGLIKSTGGKKERILKWQITPAGRKLLKGVQPLVTLLAKEL